MTPHVAVIGAGAWGIALATQAARAGNRVTLWSRSGETLLPDGSLRRLPGLVLPEAVRLTARLPDAADAVLLAVPMQHLRAVARALQAGALQAGTLQAGTLQAGALQARTLQSGTPAAPFLQAGVPLVACCKGLESDTGLLPLELLGDLHPHAPLAVLSGPNFAAEVARGLPAAAVIASPRCEQATALCDLLATPDFRLYASDDAVGVQVGAAAKNVIAIAAGAAIGGGLGENARAALITRGVAELSRLIVAMGGSQPTAFGLSGLGDLLLTCTSNASRNTSLGLALGRGESLRAVLAQRSTVAEGVATAPALAARAASLGVAVPVIETVALLLAGSIDFAQARERLLARPSGRASGEWKR